MAWNLTQLLPATLYFVAVAPILRVESLQIVPVSGLIALLTACGHLVTILLCDAS